MSQKNLPILALKLLLSGGLILWITRDIALDSVFAVIESANLVLLGLAFGLLFVGYIISAFRWRTLIRAQGGNVPILYLIRSFMVAVFFNNFLPSTVGGDIVRMYDSWRVGGSKSDAVAVVLVDRFLGVLVLLCFALIALTLDQGIVGQIPLIGWWVTAGIGGAALLAWLALNIPAARIDTLATNSGGLAKIIASALTKILGSFQVYRSASSAILRAFVLSVLLQINVVVHFVLIARGVGIMVPVESMFLIVPVAIFVMMLPLSINAIGVREAIFVFFFSLYGVPDFQALALAWISYGFTLTHGVLGGIVFAVRR